ncbi:MAG: Ig-like domain-containing protein [Bacteroidales bacterium]|nr:Ig-like domain-containing protein [Bacteroidales bacterium]
MNRLTKLLLFFILPLLFACTQKEPEVQEVRVESVTLSQSSVELEIGTTLQLNATVSPSTASRKDITWSSSKSSVASVSSSGLVTAVSEGTTTITATADGKKGECTVSVVKKAIAVSEIKLDKTELTLYEGEEETLTASVLPENATDKTITWTSSDKSIVSVESGKVKAVGKGTAKITASAGGKSASCNIEVLRPVSGISLNKTTLELPLEKTETLTATVIPSDATLTGEITWSSSNTQVATVDGGKVTAVSMGSATITVSLEGFKAECNVTVKGMEYGEIAITDLRPVDLLPVIGQVEVGDKQVYDHIEHLRLAEATRIRDMMWEYGAGNLTKEQYQQLMGRLNTGMMEEYPLGYANFDIIGEGQYGGIGDNHAHAEWSILNSLIQHANMKVVYTSGKEWQEKLEVFINENPTVIVIMGCSSYADVSKDRFIRWAENEPVRNLCRTGQVIIFKAGGNIRRVNGILINQTYQRDVDGDEHGYYSLQSNANGKDDPKADIALLVTTGTNDKGDADQTGNVYSSARFPVGFHNQVLFSGHAFPYHSLNSGAIEAEKGDYYAYQTSFPNYLNTAMMSICFQMYAEAKDVFELLEMVRSTCLTDYIRLDGETQPLQLINPAGLYKKYLTPQNLPTSISSGETVNLDKGYYKGILFSIPGTEVKIDGEWIAFDNKNKEVILSQNPMNLEWRLNGELLKKYGYTSGQTVEGQIITVDDKWGGLRLEIPMTIHVR